MKIFNIPTFDVLNKAKTYKLSIFQGGNSLNKPIWFLILICLIPFPGYCQQEDTRHMATGQADWYPYTDSQKNQRLSREKSVAIWNEIVRVRDNPEYLGSRLTKFKRRK
jgi:hypothetical protein